MSSNSEAYRACDLSSYEMKLEPSEVNIIRTALPLKNWQQVVGAIYLLAGRNYPFPNQRLVQTFQGPEEDNIVGEIIQNAGKVLKQRFQKEDVVGNLVDRAKEDVERKGRFSHSFDYEALGSSLFKTQLSIEKPEKPIVQAGQEYGYSLTAYNSETQDYPSANLAEHFDVTPRLEEALTSIPVESTDLPLILYGYNSNAKKPAAVIDLKVLEKAIFESVGLSITADILMKQILNPENKFGSYNTINLGLISDGIQVGLKTWGTVPLGWAERDADLFLVDMSSQRIALPPEYNRTYRDFNIPRLKFILSSPDSPYDLKLQDQAIRSAKSLATSFS